MLLGQQPGICVDGPPPARTSLQKKHATTPASSQRLHTQRKAGTPDIGGIVRCTRARLKLANAAATTTIILGSEYVPAATSAPAPTNSMAQTRRSRPNATGNIEFGRAEPPRPLAQTRRGHGKGHRHQRARRYRLAAARPNDAAEYRDVDQRRGTGDGDALRKRGATQHVDIRQTAVVPPQRERADRPTP